MTPEHVRGHGQCRVEGEQRNVHAPVPEAGELPQREGEQEEDGAGGQPNRRRYAVRPRAFPLDGPIDLMGELGCHGRYHWVLLLRDLISTRRERRRLRHPHRVVSHLSLLTEEELKSRGNYWSGAGAGGFSRHSAILLSRVL